MTLQVECHRCGYEWQYTGSSDYYASCPQCKTSVPIEGPDGGAEDAAETGTAETAEGAVPSGDIDGLAARVDELEATASELHGAIETMMSRVAELEKRHATVAATSNGPDSEPSKSHEDGGAAGGTAGRQQGSAVAEGGADGHRDGRGASSHGPAQAARDRGDREVASHDGGSPGAKRSNHARAGGSRSGDEPSRPDGGVRPKTDEDGKYDYICPSCDGPISGEPEACIHCGTAFTW